MRILVTGGAGYIGSMLVPQLLHDGHLVTVVDNFMYNQTPFLDKIYSSNLEVINRDVTDTEFMIKLYPNFDVIIPLACLTGMPACKANPVYAEAIVVTAVANMCLALKVAGGNTKIIYPNTNSGYGIGQTGKYCTEETPINPISLYGKLKCKAEDIIMEYGNSVSLRLATVFGASPRMRMDLMLNDFVYRALTDKYITLYEAHASRCAVHVTDVCRAFVHALDNWETMRNQIYNVGLTESNKSKLELCNKIKEHIPEFYIHLAEVGEDVDKRDYIVSNAKLEATGWKPIMTLDDGIRELIKAYTIVHRKPYYNQRYVNV